MADVFYSKRHDTAVSPQVAFTPPQGASWDLNETGLSVRLIARLPTARAPKIQAPAVVVGAWAVRYDPQPEDVDTIGAYDVEIEVTRANGKKVSIPTVGFLNWVITSDLDNA